MPQCTTAIRPETWEFTHRHIWSAAGIPRLCKGVNELTADAKVAQFDVSVLVKEDVRQFDICMQQKSNINFLLTPFLADMKSKLADCLNKIGMCKPLITEFF